MIELRLPWPPSMNTYWRSPNVGPLRGRVLLSREARNYRKEAKIWLNGVKPMKADTRLSVFFQVHAPDRRKRDIDNLVKPLLDTLQHCGVISDDGLIDVLLITRAPVVAPDGVVNVTIREYP